MAAMRRMLLRPQTSSLVARNLRRQVLMVQVRHMSKRKREGTGNDGPPEPVDMDDLFDGFDLEQESGGKGRSEQRDELLSLLEELAGDEEDDFGADAPLDLKEDAQAGKKGPSSGKMTLAPKERQLFSIGHINWEDNAKAHSARDRELTDIDLQELTAPIKPPNPAIRAKLQPDVITDTPINDHSSEDVGKYYYMGKNAEKLPQILLGQMKREFDQAKGHMLMVREAGLEAAEAVRQGDGQVVFIDGKKGMGKSAAAIYAAHAALEDNQLVLSYGMDDVGLWDDKLGRIETTPSEGLAYPSVFSMPDMSQRYFHWLRDIYETEMKKIKVKGEHGVEDYYTIHPWEDELDEELNATKKISMEKVVPQAERGSSPTLYDFLNYGSQDRKIAASLTHALFEEIRNITEIKVCIVMDDFNSVIINKKERFSTKSDFVELEHWKSIPRARLSLVDGFVYLAENPPKNGSIVVAPTYNSHRKHGLKTFEKYHVTKKVELGRYSKEENKNAFLHYSLSCALQPTVEWDAFPRICGLTGRHPEEFRKFTELGIA